MRSFFYSIKQGFLQIFRYRGMSLASIFAIFAMLLILGLCFTIMINVNLFSEVVKQDYDQVEVFLEPDVSEADAAELMEKIQAQDGVVSVAYRDKEDALSIMKERWGESGYLLDSLGENPLPASIIINVDSLDNAGAAADFAGSLDGIEDVQYYRETVEKLTKITDFLQIAAVVIILFLVVVSIVIVSNTIKLTVAAREQEIRIMKYVGATNWFIRGPFLAEGIIIGIIASLLSAFLMRYIYTKIMAAVGEQIFAIISSPLISVDFMTQNLIIIFLALGVSIGACGSIISMRRYLDA